MDFRKMAAHKLQLLLLGICVAVSAWILHTDAIGYDTRIPTMAKTEGISLNLEWIGTESVNEPQMEVSSGSYKLDRLFILWAEIMADGQMQECQIKSMKC